MASTATSAEPERGTNEAQAADAGETRPLLLFNLLGRVYACEVAPVREIVPFRRCTRLPGAPPHVCGLINLRGSIVTVIDLGRRLGLTDAAREAGSVILVESGTRVVGLGVDEVQDVQPATESQFESPVASAPEDAAVSGVGHVAGQVVVLLDVEAIVRHALL